MSKKIDVSIVRESISKLVSLLTSKSIRVTQRGMKAYVEYTPAGKIKGMNIPYLPDDASEEFIAAVQGFIDHEVGHVLHTDPAYVKKAHAMGATFAGMHNIIEDTYIERMMQGTFHGSKRTLDAVRKFHIEKMASPKIKAALEASDKATATAYMIVLVFRAWAGQSAAKEYLSSSPELQALAAEIEGRVGTDLLAQIGAMESSKDTYDMTVKIMERMRTAEEKKPKPKPSTAKAVSVSEEDKSEPTSDDDGDDLPADEGESTLEPATDDDSASTEASVADPEPEPEPEPTPEASEVKITTEEQEEKRGDETTGSVTADADSEPDPEPEDETAGMGTDPDDAQDDAEVGAADHDDDDDSTDEDGAGDTAESSLGSDGDTDMPPAEETGSTALDDDVNSGEVGEDELIDPEEEAAPPAEEISLDEVFDKFIDFDDAVSTALTKEAKVQSNSVICPVFSNEFDKIEIFDKEAPEDRTKALEERVAHMIAPMAKSLQRALSAKDKVVWNPGQRRGRISAGALYRSAVGDDRIFRTRYESKAKNVAVTLLVDCSGSMHSDNRIVSAFQAAFALSSTLDRLKITHEVIGFTTTKDRRTELRRAVRSEADADVYYARGEPLYMPIFKSFDERLGHVQKSRMACMTTYEGERILRENVDGESLRIAAGRLRRQKAERHIVIVLSDGQPSCESMGTYTRETYERHRTLAGGLSPLAGDLKAAVQEVTESGVEVVGVGIQHAGVSAYYPKSVNLTSVAQLPVVVMDQLTKLLLA